MASGTIKSNATTLITSSTHIVQNLDFTKYDMIYVEGAFSNNPQLRVVVAIPVQSLPTSGYQQYLCGKADHSISIRVTQTSAEIYEWTYSNNNYASACGIRVYGSK